MDVRDLVRQHYGHSDLSGAIVHALAEAGADVDRLGPADLFPVDQLHVGGAPATRYLLERLEVGPGSTVLDVGSGIGGASRLAAMTGASVTGIDLSPEFVAAATHLTGRVGLGERARFVVTPGEELPLEDGTFDTAMMLHVGMNVPDKAAVFAEVHRVLRPGSIFGLFEQVRMSEGDLPYPLPWAEDERSSFVESAAAYRRHLETAGFTVVEVEDRTAAAAGAPPPGTLGNAVVFGPAFTERIRNNVAATRSGLLAAVLLLAQA
jgi:MPBQ/MSBQ methyltransferase